MRPQPLAWLVILVGVVTLLAVGARRTPDTGLSEDRLFTLGEQMKCLACAGESVANSQAPLAVEMRGQIRTQMRAGHSDDEILTYFADRYGPRVLLNPSSTGLASLVWIIPVVVSTTAAAGLVLFITRSRGRWGPMPSVSDEDRQLVERVRQDRS